MSVKFELGAIAISDRLANFYYASEEFEFRFRLQKNSIAAPALEKQVFQEVHIKIKFIQETMLENESLI